MLVVHYITIVFVRQDSAEPARQAQVRAWTVEARGAPSAYESKAAHIEHPLGSSSVGTKGNLL